MRKEVEAVEMGKCGSLRVVKFGGTVCLEVPNGKREFYLSTGKVKSILASAPGDLMKKFIADVQTPKAAPAVAVPVDDGMVKMLAQMQADAKAMREQIAALVGGGRQQPSVAAKAA